MIPFLGLILYFFVAWPKSTAYGFTTSYVVVFYMLYDLQRHMSWYFICSMIYNVICRGILYVLYDLQRHVSWYFICAMIYNVICRGILYVLYDLQRHMWYKKTNSTKSRKMFSLNTYAFVSRVTFMPSKHKYLCCFNSRRRPVLEVEEIDTNKLFIKYLPLNFIAILYYLCHKSRFYEMYTC
jgi:hypothetical protein